MKLMDSAKQLNNYYKLFTFWAEIHAFSRFCRVRGITARFFDQSNYGPLFFATRHGDRRRVRAEPNAAPSALERTQPARAESVRLSYGAVACVATRMRSGCSWREQSPCVHHTAL